MLSANIITNTNCHIIPKIQNANCHVIPSPTPISCIKDARPGPDQAQPARLTPFSKSRTILHVDIQGQQSDSSKGLRREHADSMMETGGCQSSCGLDRYTRIIV